ncbi:hypothetical protein [Streptomyces griseofuscus]|uniref:hypothetical protein n=1 Tax=Streptomyces griseofuscus TaxID=146922 RepID=UPI0034537049
MREAVGSGEQAVGLAQPVHEAGDQHDRYAMAQVKDLGARIALGIEVVAAASHASGEFD